MLNASWSTSASTSWSWSTSKSWSLRFDWVLSSADESATLMLPDTSALDVASAADLASPPIANQPLPPLPPSPLHSSHLLSCFFFQSSCFLSFLSQSPQPSSPPSPPRPPIASPPKAADAAFAVEVAVLVCDAEASPVSIALVCVLGALIVELCVPVAVAVPS